MDFQTERSVQIQYREKSYNGAVSFNGNLLVLTVFSDDKGEDKFSFTIDNMTCTTDFNGLQKVYQTNDVPKSFLPVIIFNFFNQTGAYFNTELYNEELDTYSVTRVIDNISVCLEVSKSGENLIYLFKIE